jgi:predicted ferric reductase
MNSTGRTADFFRNERAAPDAGRRTLFGILVGAVLAGSLALVGAPVPIILDAGFVAHIAGFLAGYAVAVMVVLMSRMPLLERTIGSDRLARWHTRGGRVFIVLMLTHAISATAAWTTAQQVDPVTSIAQVLGFPGMFAALVATLIFLGVAAISIRTARRRVAYETWHGIHLLTYVALALAFVHELAGPNLAGLPILQVVWSLLFVVPLGLVVRYRLLRPIEHALRHRLVVDRVVTEADGVVSIVLRGHHVDELRAEAGQFFRWRFLTRTTWRSAHPFSLSSSPRGDWLRVTVKALGAGTTLVHSVRPGTRVLAEGPYGAMTLARRTRASVLLVAGGVGITPMRALFEEIDRSIGDVTLLYRISRPEDAVFRDELEQIERARGGRIIWMIGRSSDPTNSFGRANLLRLVPDLADRDVYLCASPTMASAVREGLRDAGVPAHRLHEEVFAF